MVAKVGVRWPMRAHWLDWAFILTLVANLPIVAQSSLPILPVVCALYFDVLCIPKPCLECCSIMPLAQLRPSVQLPRTRYLDCVQPHVFHTMFSRHVVQNQCMEHQKIFYVVCRWCFACKTMVLECVGCIVFTYSWTKLIAYPENSAGLVF